MWNPFKRTKVYPVATVFSDGTILPLVSGGAAPWPTDPQAESYAAGAYDCHVWNGTGGVPADRATRPSDGGTIYTDWYHLGWNMTAKAETKTLKSAP